MTVKHSARELVLFAEATAALTAASLAIKLLPFKTLMKSATRTPRPERSAASEGLPADVTLAVRRASRRLPWKTLCFQEGLAAQWMLRRRGYPSVLHYGVRIGDEDLSAHVWVSLGDAIVIGEEERDPHTEVARFPSA